MKILFDNGTPNPIARRLVGHEVAFARQIGWHELETSDKNIRYQQNLSERTIAIVVLSNRQWPDVRLQLNHIAAAVNTATPGSYTEVEIPRRA